MRASTRMNRRTYWAILAAGAAASWLLRLYVGGGLLAGFGAVAFMGGVYRLHDIERTGSWVMLAFVPVAIMFGLNLAGIIPDRSLDLAGNIVLAVIAIPLVVLGLVPGKPGANRFGEPARGWV